MHKSSFFFSYGRNDGIFVVESSLDRILDGDFASGEALGSLEDFESP